MTAFKAQILISFVYIILSVRTWKYGIPTVFVNTWLWSNIIVGYCCATYGNYYPSFSTSNIVRNATYVWLVFNTLLTDKPTYSAAILLLKCRILHLPHIWKIIYLWIFIMLFYSLKFSSLLFVQYILVAKLLYNLKCLLSVCPYFKKNLVLICWLR